MHGMMPWQRCIASCDDSDIFNNNIYPLSVERRTRRNNTLDVCFLFSVHQTIIIKKSEEHIINRRHAYLTDGSKYYVVPCCCFIMKYSFLLFFFADCESHLTTSPRPARLWLFAKSSAKIKTRVVNPCTHHQSMYTPPEKSTLWKLREYPTSFLAFGFFVLFDRPDIWPPQSMSVVQWLDLFSRYPQYPVILDPPPIRCTWATLYAVTISRYIQYIRHTHYTPIVSQHTYDAGRPAF